MSQEGAHGYRAALAHPVTRRLWQASAVSALGDYIGQGALLLLAYERGGRRVIFPAILFAATAVPALLSGVMVGSWLDQIARHRALAGLHVLGALAISVPIVFRHGLVPIFVAAGLLGVVKTANIAVRSGAMADGVPDQHRGPLIGLIGTTDQAATVVGFVTGALLKASVGASFALTADALTFLLAAVLLSQMTFQTPARRTHRPAITAGLRDIFADPVLRILAPLAWVTATVGALPETLAAGATEGHPEWTPWVLASGAAGQATTMLFVGRLKLVSRPSVQLIHLAWLALALAIAALGNSPPFYVLANFLVGSGAAWLIGPQLTFVRVAPAERMAQITGTMVAIIILAEGLGTPAFAYLADHTSIATAYRVAGFLVLFSALAGWAAKERTPAATALDRDEYEAR